jgi:hypothetical protein
MYPDIYMGEVYWSFGYCTLLGHLGALPPCCVAHWVSDGLEGVGPQHEFLAHPCHAGVEPVHGISVSAFDPWLVVLIQGIRGIVRCLELRVF